MKPGWQKIVVSLFVSFEVLYLSGCATIFTGDKDRTVFINSNPQGARVTSDKSSCLTPCSLLFTKPFSENKIRIWKKGYKHQETTLRRSIHWSWWINFGLLTLGLIPAGIDLISYNMWVLKNRNVFADLEVGDDSKVVTDKDLNDEAFEKDEGAEDTVNHEENDNINDFQSKTDSTAFPETYIPTTNIDTEKKNSQKNDVEYRNNRIRVIQIFPFSYVARQLEYYFGKLSKSRKLKISNRIYDQLAKMKMAGERLDIDEAIRRYRIELP